MRPPCFDASFLFASQKQWACTFQYNIFPAVQFIHSTVASLHVKTPYTAYYDVTAHVATTSGLNSAWPPQMIKPVQRMTSDGNITASSLAAIQLTAGGKLGWKRSSPGQGTKGKRVHTCTYCSPEGKVCGKVCRDMIEVSLDFY